MVQTLRLKTNPQWVHKMKYFPLMKRTYILPNRQASYFNMKVLVFAEPGHMRFFFSPLLTWVVIKGVDISVPTQTLSALVALRGFGSTARTSTALLMATVLLYNTDQCLKKTLCGVFRSYTTQIETAEQYVASAQLDKLSIAHPI